MLILTKHHCTHSELKAKSDECMEFLSSYLFGIASCDLNMLSRLTTFFLFHSWGTFFYNLVPNQYTMAFH